MFKEINFGICMCIKHSPVLIKSQFSKFELLSVLYILYYFLETFVFPLFCYCKISIFKRGTFLVLHLNPILAILLLFSFYKCHVLYIDMLVDISWKTLVSCYVKFTRKVQIKIVWKLFDSVFMYKKETLGVIWKIKDLASVIKTKWNSKFDNEKKL